MVLLAAGAAVAAFDWRGNYRRWEELSERKFLTSQAVVMLARASQAAKAQIALGGVLVAAGATLGIIWALAV